MSEEAFLYYSEYWTGDSRDGQLLDGDGYHYFKMTEDGLIVSAYEVYSSDAGEEIISPLPEMRNVNWFDDLGFEDFETLDEISEAEFNRAKELSSKS